jgi:hypothetical protein
LQIAELLALIVFQLALLSSVKLPLFPDFVPSRIATFPIPRDIRVARLPFFPDLIDVPLSGSEQTKIIIRLPCGDHHSFLNGSVIERGLRRKLRHLSQTK